VSAKSASETPDLSGVWGRNTIDYTAPATGKGPVKNISGSRNVMVGDYNDPMLKPWAAEIVKRNGEIAKTGDAFPTAHNQCWPEPPPYILGNQQLQVLQQKDQALLMYYARRLPRPPECHASGQDHAFMVWRFHRPL
jgi:hypothetical protein